MGPDAMRKLKVVCLQVARALGLFRLARRMTGRGVRILGYHGVWMGDPRFPGDCMFILPETFAHRLDRVRALGYPIISLERATSALRRGESLPACATVITIDDGWYGTYVHMVPALEARGVPATLYCNTAQLLAGQPIWHVMAKYLHATVGRPPLDPDQQALFARSTDLRGEPAQREEATRAFGRTLGLDVDSLVQSRAFGYMTPRELRQMADRGVVDVQLHTHTHSLHDMSRDAVGQELAMNTESLTAVLGGSPKRFRHFCYPSGVTSDSAAAALDALGIAGATTCDPGLSYPGDDLQRMGRFLDGDNVHAVELEAELSGFMHLVRTRGSGWRARRRVTVSAATATETLPSRQRAA